MAKAKKVENKEEEIEAGDAIVYENTLDEYNDKRKQVDLSVDMIATDFWAQGFKSRQDTFSKAHAKMVEVVASSNCDDDYDNTESIKEIDKANLDHKNAAKALDQYVMDVVKVVDQLHVFCTQEDLPLFKDVTFMSASFSRKTGKIKSFKA